MLRSVTAWVGSYLLKAPADSKKTEAVEEMKSPQKPVNPLSTVVTVPDDEYFPKRSDETNTAWEPVNKNQTRFVSCDEFGHIDLIDLEQKNFYQQVKCADNGLPINLRNDRLALAYADMLCSYQLTFDSKNTFNVTFHKRKKVSLLPFFFGTKEKKCNLSENQVVLVSANDTDMSQPVILNLINTDTLTVESDISATLFKPEEMVIIQDFAVTAQKKLYLLTSTLKTQEREKYNRKLFEFTINFEDRHLESPKIFSLPDNMNMADLIWDTTIADVLVINHSGGDLVQYQIVGDKLVHCCTLGKTNHLNLHGLKESVHMLPHGITAFIDEEEQKVVTVDLIDGERTVYPQKLEADDELFFTLAQSRCHLVIFSPSKRTRTLHEVPTYDYDMMMERAEGPGAILKIVLDGCPFFSLDIVKLAIAFALDPSQFTTKPTLLSDYAERDAKVCVELDKLSAALETGNSLHQTTKGLLIEFKNQIADKKQNGKLSYRECFELVPEAKTHLEQLKSSSRDLQKVAVCMNSVFKLVRPTIELKTDETTVKYSLTGQ